MDNTPKNEEETPVASGGKQTPIDPMQRRTGQGTSQDVRDGAEEEAPATNSNTPGSPNQGTDAR